MPERTLSSAFFVFFSPVPFQRVMSFIGCHPRGQRNAARLSTLSQPCTMLLEHDQTRQHCKEAKSVEQGGGAGGGDDEDDDEGDDPP